jgi:integrase
MSQDLISYDLISRDGDLLQIQIKDHRSYHGAGKTITISATNLDLFAQYVDELRALRHGEPAITVSKSHIRQFIMFLGPKKFVDVTKDDLKKYFTDELRSRMSQQTVYRHFISLNSLYNFLVDEMELLPTNPVRGLKKYMKTFKTGVEPSSKQVISVEEAGRLVSTAFSSRDKAILLVGLKCGLRLHEIGELDVGGVNLEKRIIRINPTPKRSFNYCFIDNELMRVLKRWLARREVMLQRLGKKSDALFISERGTRLSNARLARMIRQTAIAAGICSTDPDADTSEKFSSHCMRYYFTNAMRRSGMMREYLQILRGDKVKEAIDVYIKPSMKELLEEYLKHVPQLGIA